MDGDGNIWVVDNERVAGMMPAVFFYSSFQQIIHG